MRVLGVDVGPALARDWAGWLAPAVQPFFVDALDDWPVGADPRPLPPELRDTYKVWRIPSARQVLWLDEPAFLELPRSRRAALVRTQVECGRGAVPTVRHWQGLLDPTALRSQADGHRFVWWPSLLAADPTAIVRRVVSETEVLPSRHAEVPAAVWQDVAAVLPGAHRLAGTFPPASGPNCFGTVMAAAGVAGAADEWMLVAPFARWLESTCFGGGVDDDPGTVLVWRDAEHQPVHAVVTLGGGWALEKASQEWCTPRSVLRVEDVIRTNRTVGQRLERHRIVRSS